MSNYSIPKSVFFTEVDGEGVILNLKNGIYYGLNETSTIVWEQIKIGNDVEKIIELIELQYDVEAFQLKNDISVIINDFIRMGLLERVTN